MFAITIMITGFGITVFGITAMNKPMLALGMPGLPEMLLIALVILLLFGAKRLPELARGLGKGIREFRGAVSETSDQLKQAMDEPEKPSDSANLSIKKSEETKADDSKIDNSKSTDA